MASSEANENDEFGVPGHRLRSNQDGSQLAFQYVYKFLILRKFTEILLLHPQRTLDLEYQDDGDDFKIKL